MIQYLIHSTLCLTLLLLIYQLVLARERMHHFNRFYLLFSLTFSLVVPLIPVGLNGGLLGWLVADISVASGYELSRPTLDTVAVISFSEAGLIPVLEMVSILAFAIYGMITMSIFAHFLVNLDTIQFKARRSPRIAYKDAEIVLFREKITPFSFRRHIFLNEEAYRKGKIDSNILAHEYAHVRQRHSYDILLVEILRVFFWFQPLIYLYRKAIRLNHEYLADEAVLYQTDRRREYQLLLLDSVRSRSGGVLASPLSRSMLRNRIEMMGRSYSRTRVLVRKMAAIPILAGAGLLFGCQMTGSDTEALILGPDRTLTIEVIDSDNIRLNGREMPVSLLESHLSHLTDSAGVVADLKVAPNAHSGVVRDVQKSLRKNNLVEIQYRTILE